MDDVSSVNENQSTNADARARSADEYEFAGKDAAESIDLVELHFWPPRQGERLQSSPIWVDLRFAEQTVTTDTWRVQIRLLQAELAAEFEGCSVEQGTRLGDIQKKLFQTTTGRRVGEVYLSGSGEVSGRIGVGLTEGASIGISAQASGKAEKSSKTATERAIELSNDRIVALPNNRWRVIEVDGEFLDGTYLRAPGREEKDDAPLCWINISKNEFTVILSLKARPQDLRLHLEPLKLKNWWAPSVEKPNKEAIAKLLVQAAATSRFNRAGDERITLARCLIKGRKKGPPEVQSGEQL